MKEEKILTKHPLGKSGKNLRKPDYDLFTNSIIEILKGKELTHTELMKEVNHLLTGKFEGNISWYAETIKLHLEAVGIIERTMDKPQKYRLKGKVNKL